MPEAIGPLEVVRGLVEAPGVTFAEGLDPLGERRLVQVAFCRLTSTPEEAAELDAYAGVVANATEHLERDEAPRAASHGTHAAPDGRRVLYWSLPWLEGAERLGHAAEMIAVPGDLVSLAVSLVERLVERHARGRVDPLLSEDTLIIGPSGGAVVAGLSIHLPRAGLEPSARAARVTPEEAATGDPTPGGDVWRAGQVLRALAVGLEPLPEGLRAVIDGLADPDPQTRTIDLAKVLDALRELTATVDDTAAVEVPARRWSTDQDELPTPEALRASYEAERTDPMPLARMRAEAPEIPTIEASEAPTSLDMRLPPALRAKAALELEALRRGGHAYVGNDTLVDMPPSMLLGEDATIDESNRPLARDVAVDPELRHPIETTREARDPAVRAQDAWSKVKGRAGPLLEDRGPGGTVVGSRPLGPDGTVVGIKPVHALELLAKQRAAEGLAGPGEERPPFEGPDAWRGAAGRDAPVTPRGTERDAPMGRPGDRSADRSVDRSADRSADRGLDRAVDRRAARPVEVPDRGRPLIGVPTAVPLREPTTSEFIIQPPARVLSGGAETGEFESPAAIRSVRAETSDDLPVSKELASRAAAALAAAQAELARAGGAGPAGGPDAPGAGAASGAIDGSFPSIRIEPAVTLRGPIPGPTSGNPFGPELAAALGQGPIGAPGAPGPGGVPALGPGGLALGPGGLALGPGGLPAIDAGSEGYGGGALQQLPGQPSVGLAAGAQAGGPGDARSAAVGGRSRREARSKGARVRRVALSAFVVLGMVAAAVVVAGRQIVLPERGRERSQHPAEVTPANDVALSVVPASALVVGEEDGRVLGASPVAFLLAAGAPPTVLITAPGFVAERVVLPEGGTPNVALQRHGGGSCSIRVFAPAGVVLAPVGDSARATTATAAPSSDGALFTVAGGAVLRAASGGRGAWLVKCPELGGQPVQTLPPRTELHTERVHVAEPANVLFFADGRLGGTAPASMNVDAGFVRMRVQSTEGPFVERWIPVFKNTLLKMPSPEAAD